MIQFLLLISRHGKTRLNKYYRHYTQKERTSIQKEVSFCHSEPLLKFEIEAETPGRVSQLPRT